MTSTSKNIRILIIENEAPVADELEIRLKGLGYNVCGKAIDSKQTLNLVQQTEPDLVMMNLALKENPDGLDTAEVVRDQHGVPIVFLTSFADADRLEQNRLSYPFSYLMKPFLDKDLGITIEMSLYAAQVDRERHQAEAGLRKSEEKFRSITEQMTETVYLTDQQGVITYMSPVAEEIFGFRAEEMVRRHFMEFLAEESIEKALTAFMTSFEQGTPVKNLELRMKRKDGTIFSGELQGRPYHSQGVDAGTIGIIRDVTEKKAAEEALRESEERFRLTFLTSPDSININRLHDGLYVDINEGFTRLTGFSREDVLGQTSLAIDIWHDPADRDRLVAGLREKGSYDNLEAVFRRKDGTLATALMSARIIFLQGVPHIISVTRDISDLRRAQEEQEKLQAQLQQAQKMEAVGTLAGGIAHDFNNLLQAISGYTQLLLYKKDEDNEDFASLKAIQAAGMKASQLVRQLLLFSRKAGMERKPIELNHEVEHAHRMLERTIPKMIDIEARLAERLWPINADPVQMEQILLNLGTNAADAMPEGGRLVITTENVMLDEDQARLRLRAEPGPFVLLTVSDTGQGMAGDVMDKIFEPFFTTKEIGKGTGLGLASVYGIVQNHQGYITCDSEVGRGTAFKIFLPALEQESEGQAEVLAVASPPGGTETILIVDDEESIRTFASQALQMLGYRALTASTGEEALETYAREQGDIGLVIMDLGMPGMGGHRCFSKLISLDPSARVLIASGYAVNNETKQTLDAGAAGYIGKPFELDELLTKVREALDEVKSGDRA